MTARNARGDARPHRAAAVDSRRADAVPIHLPLIPSHREILREVAAELQAGQDIDAQWRLREIEQEFRNQARAQARRFRQRFI